MDNPKKWFWAQGLCPREAFDVNSLLLFEAGVQALEELDVDLPEGGIMPDDPRAHALLQGNEILERSTTQFRFFTDDFGERNRIVTQFPQFRWTVGEEEAQDWDRHWRERQHPVAVSPHLWVRPPWVEFSAPEPESVVLVLEAKSAFGTGEHESTALSAELMEGLDLRGIRLLDIGTGTGILSMFACKRGARGAVFTEIDPLAIPCLNENFAVNGCASQVMGYLGGLECMPGKWLFDVVVCNMIRSEVWPLRADIVRLLRPGAALVLSGQLLLTDKPLILEWFALAGFVLERELIRNEWWAVCARKTS
ncbi:MAG TPA: 50S ribosomal protein L11 methyltransferase [Fibrobacteraceae bacterium]|nr:50S ribosomal protein L11 methyltransferase [Fibrobacteraceae bacterium]